MFMCAGNFGMTFCSNIEDDEELATLLASMPHSEHFEKFIIE
jgi:hypothetical protein